MIVQHLVRAAALVAFASGCAPDESRPALAPQPPAPAQYAPIAPRASNQQVEPERVDGVRLPISMAPLQDARHALVVSVTLRHVVVQDETVLVTPPVALMAASGFDVRYKAAQQPTSMLLVPVHDAVERLRGDRITVLLRADRDIPHRAMLEIIFTLGQSGIRAIIEATTPEDAAPGFARGWPLWLPSSLEEAPGVYLVFLVHDGMVLKVPRGNVSPGCQTYGAGVTLPKVGSVYDFAGLTSCVTSIQASMPEVVRTSGMRADSGYIAANEDVPQGTIVRTIEALAAAGIVHVGFKVPQ